MGSDKMLGALAFEEARRSELVEEIERAFSSWPLELQAWAIEVVFARADSEEPRQERP